MIPFTPSGIIAGLAALGLTLGTAAISPMATVVGRAYEVALPLPPALQTLPGADQRQGASRSTIGASDPAVKRVLWLTPLNPVAFNVFVVGEANAGASAAKLDTDFMVLSRLSWRADSAQRNLMLRAIERENIGETLDRADSLLRRRRVTPETFQLMQVLEVLPQTHDLLVGRLLAGVPWRDPYLIGTGRYPSAALASARLATLSTLIRSGERPTLAATIPFLAGLVDTGRAADAYALWNRAYRLRSAAAGIVNDPGFAAAPQADAATPFDWRFSTGPGFAALPGDRGGLEISWDGRGVPIFATQRVPLVPGRSYVLTLVATGAPSGTLTVAVGCGEQRTTPMATRSTATETRYAVTLPAGTCAVPELTIGGAVRDGAAPITMHVDSVRIAAAG